LKKSERANSGKSDRDASARYLKYGFAGFIILIAAALALAMYFIFSPEYVATVGSEKITSEEFKFFLKQEKDSMLQIAENPDPETFWNTKIDGENAIDVAKNKALERARDLKIQVIKAKEHGKKLEKAEEESLNKSIKDFIAQNNNSTTEADKASVSYYGVKLNEFKKIYKQYILMQKVMQEELGEIKVSEDEIKTYYENNPDWFKNTDMRPDGGEALWARHILIKADKGAPEDELKKAKEKAEEILQKAKNGEDFAQLAKENSEDGNAQYGGDYVFGRGVMVSEFEEAAFGLAPGQISGLVQTDFGFHIIKLEEKYEKDQPVSLKCAQEYREFGTSLIRSELYSQKYDEKMEEWKKDPRYELKKNQKVFDSIR
jgi:foldase protein PrsA